MNDINLTPEEKSDIDELTKNLMKKLNDKEVQYIVNLSYWLTKYKENNDNGIEFIDRYLQLDLNEFDMKGLLLKIKEILGRDING